MPTGLPHAIYNKSERTVKCMFWVSAKIALYPIARGSTSDMRLTGHRPEHADTRQDSPIQGHDIDT
jgi:hypothetical protein